MDGSKKDLEDDFDDEIEKEIDEDFPSDLDDEFDEEYDEDGTTSRKKDKSESTGFNRDNYYFYKEKLVQLSGMIKPKERNSEGQVIALEFKTDEKVYSVVMDEMGKKLLKSCFQELLVTGLISKITEKEHTIAIKTYI